MKNSLRGRVVVITGAGSGIGRALALRCARSGSKLALADVNPQSLKSTVEAVLQCSAQVIFSAFDVSKAEAFKTFASQVESALGRVDILFNNAGVSLSEVALDTKRSDFEWLFNINFWGTVNGCEAFRDLLLRSPAASIVNISSLFGLIGIPHQSAYCASKFAVRGYSESLRNELISTPIRVSIVFPGGVNTDIVRNGRHYADLSGQKTDTATYADNFAKIAKKSPDEAAQTIIDGVLKGKERILVGKDAVFFDKLIRFQPEFASRLLLKLVSLAKQKLQRMAQSPGSTLEKDVPKKEDREKRKITP